MPKIFDLRPNKDLTNSNFEKYQFSSEIIPIIEEKSLSKHVLRIEPSSGQDSWLEARLFAFHNHLFKNPFDSSCWFYDEHYQVWQIKQDKTLNLIYSFNLEKFHKNASVFNPTISFASDDIVILTRDDNHLQVILISSNIKLHKSYVIDNIEPGILLDSRYIKEKSLLIIAMCCIIEESRKKQSKLIIFSYLMKSKENKVESLNQLVQKRELTVNGPIEYVYIESNGDFINILSQDIVKFTLDQSEKIQETICHTNSDEIITKIPKYSWSQDEDSLTVWITIPMECKGIKPKINILPTTISVTVDNNVIIQGKFKFRIDNETVVWDFKEDTLKLDLIKCESGLMWNELIINDTNGECIPNKALAAEIHSRLSHLCTDRQQDNNIEQSMIGFNSEQLEECDLEDKDNILQRINLTTQITTNLAIFGSRNRILFAYNLKSYQVLCSRYDHDSCIWKLVESEPDDWSIIHTTTFPGFGYVEASKCNKKFCITPPNFSYIAIIEHTKYGFLYEKPNKNARVAKQKIIDLGVDIQPIIGAVATNENIILLTIDKLYTLKVT